MSNYKVPTNVPKNEEFIYNLIDKMYTIGSQYGFAMGAFTGLIEHMEKGNVSKEFIDEANNVFDQIDQHLSNYNKECYDIIIEEWVRLGKPLSMEAHIAKKKQLDAKDDHRAEYCDR